MGIISMGKDGQVRDGSNLPPMIYESDMMLHSEKTLNQRNKILEAQQKAELDYINKIQSERIAAEKQKEKQAKAFQKRVLKEQKPFLSKRNIMKEEAVRQTMTGADFNMMNVINGYGLRADGVKGRLTDYERIVDGNMGEWDPVNDLLNWADEELGISTPQAERDRLKKQAEDLAKKAEDLAKKELTNLSRQLIPGSGSTTPTAPASKLPIKIPATINLPGFGTISTAKLAAYVGGTFLGVLILVLVLKRRK